METFQKLFKKVEAANELNKLANNQLLKVNFTSIYRDDFDSESEAFSTYKEFKKYMMEERNDAKEILEAEFNINERHDYIWGVFKDKGCFIVTIIK